MCEPLCLLAIPEVAARLSVSRRMVEKLIHDGELRTRHVGRLVRVTNREVERYIARGERRRVA